MNKLTEAELMKLATEQPIVAAQEVKKEEPALRRVIDKAKTIAAPAVTAGGVVVGAVANIKPKHDFKTI